MSDGFCGEGLFRGVDQGQIDIQCRALFQDLFLEPVGLFGSSAEEVAFVGAFVELFGDGEEDLDVADGVGFGEPDVSEREDESAFAIGKKSAHRSQRAKPFVAWKRVR